MTTGKETAYDNPTGEATVQKHHSIPHIRRIGEEKEEDARRPR
jgi:hypothetical protein